MKKISFYIGSNNQTKILEKEKALAILSLEYEWMSATEIVGYWHGNQEKTLLVNIVAESVDFTQVKRVATNLKTSLDQEAIMVEIVDTNTLFI